MPQLKEALRRAGFYSPNERLRDIAIEAMEFYATSNEVAIEKVLCAVRDDLALTWALFTPYDQLAVKKLFNDIRHEMRQDEKARGAGQGKIENHTRAAPSQPASRPITPAQREAKAQVAEVVRLSLLDTFTIDGRPIGDWQAGEARAWARKTGRHVRWVEMLTSNMPTDDPIRRWITAEDAQGLWQRAAREGDDA